ncbi:hypothetical protein U1Q18_047209 [Sarracenia purpurea var. burkii]
MIDEHSNEPKTTIDIDDSNHQDQETVSLKETNILKVCFRIYQGLISWYSMLYFGKIFAKVLILSETTAEVDEESEFFVPFLCDTCNTTFSYVLAYNSSFFFVLPIGIFFLSTLSLFMVLSIYLKNRAIVLRNDITFYSDAATEKFESYDRLEEQELKRRHPSDFQLREIAQLRERQVRDYMDRVHRWIRIHQRLVG